MATKTAAKTKSAPPAAAGPTGRIAQVIGARRPRTVEQALQAPTRHRR